jgi:hypothetical protein
MDQVRQPPIFSLIQINLPHSSNHHRCFFTFNWTSPSQRSFSSCRFKFHNAITRWEKEDCSSMFSQSTFHRGVCTSILSFYPLHSCFFFSALQHSHYLQGLWSVVSAGLWSVRHIFLKAPRMKCRCPYSASAMIGHAHSVERLYPSWGKHELQSSLFREASPP